MRDSVLNQYLQPKQSRVDADDLEQVEGLADLGAFGFLRGIHERSLMLELRHKNGNVDGFPYAWLTRASFDPSEGITLRFGAETIKITGRNLNAEVRPNVRLFAGILRHRVSWIQEADQAAALQAGNHDIIIERIKL